MIVGDFIRFLGRNTRYYFYKLIGKERSRRSLNWETDNDLSESFVNSLVGFIVFFILFYAVAYIFY